MKNITILLAKRKRNTILWELLSSHTIFLSHETLWHCGKIKWISDKLISMKLDLLKICPLNMYWLITNLEKLSFIGRYIELHDFWQEEEKNLIGVWMIEKYPFLRKKLFLLLCHHLTKRSGIEPTRKTFSSSYFHFLYLPFIFLLVALSPPPANWHMSQQNTVRDKIKSKL